MAHLPILTFPAQSLKKASVPVEKVTSKITDFVHDMFETMYAAEGIGLAAPQVGENLNLVVLDVSHSDRLTETEKIAAKPSPICLINPRILKSDGTIVYEEGCLSCPELIVGIERAKNIVVEALDAEGRPITVNLSDLAAVCTQHEMDHLQGKLLTDYISRLKRDVYKKQRLRARTDENDRGDV